jgi:hypothetical protein
VLIESDPTRRMLTTFTVDPDPQGGSIVRIETCWYADGLQGLVERIVAPKLLRGVYEAELNLLDRYARDQVPDARRGIDAGKGVISLV